MNSKEIKEFREVWSSKLLFIKEEYGFCTCEYELTMALLDDSIYEQDDLKEITKACQFVLGGTIVYLHIKEAIEDWLENNYTKI